MLVHGAEVGLRPEIVALGQRLEGLQGGLVVPVVIGIDGDPVALPGILPVEGSGERRDAGKEGPYDEKP